MGEMIILDTKVLSELMLRRPNPQVKAWADAQSRRQLVTTVISVMELHTGLLVIPAGKRRTELTRMIANTFDELLGGRILHFDYRAAIATAELHVSRRKAGGSGDLRDTQIAGIALSRRIPIATRNVMHFGDIDVKVINPWQG